MRQEELQLLRNLRMAASAEAAFLNGELSMLGRSFNYDTDLKLARCELDALECLIGLIDCRFAAYKGTWSLGDAVIRSEAVAESEVVRNVMAAPVRQARKRGRKPKAREDDAPKTEPAPLQAFERPDETADELQRREDACVALWEETHDWQRILKDEPLMVESSRFRHEVAKRCGLKDDGTAPKCSEKDARDDIAFMADRSREALELRERSEKLRSKSNDRIASEIDTAVDGHGSAGRTPLFGMELESGMTVEFPSVVDAAKAVDPDADINTSKCAVLRCARRMWDGLFKDGPDAIRRHEDFEKMTYNGWAFQFKNANANAEDL